MSVSFREDTTRYNEEVLLNGFLYKGLCVSSWNLWKDIESALWLLDIKLFSKPLIDQIPFRFISFNITLHIEVQGLDRCLLGKGVDAGERVLLKGDHLLEDFLRACRITQSPPSHSPTL